MYTVKYCGLMIGKFPTMQDVKNFVFHHLATDKQSTYEIYRGNKEYARFAWNWEKNDIMKVNF